MGNNRFDNLTVHGMMLEVSTKPPRWCCRRFWLLYAGVNYPFQYIAHGFDADGSMDSWFSVWFRPGLTVNGGDWLNGPRERRCLGTTNPWLSGFRMDPPGFGNLGAVSDCRP